MNQIDDDVLSSGLKSKKLVAEAMVVMVFVRCACCWYVEYDLKRPSLVGKFEICGKLVEEVTIRECKGDEDDGKGEDVSVVVDVGYSKLLTTVLDGTKEWTRAVRIAGSRSRFLISCSRDCRVLPVADMAQRRMYELLLLMNKVLCRGR